MAMVTFYEKPGCLNNAKQKQLLVAAGHQLIVKNLLTEPWQAPQLRAFFGRLPVAAWFNNSAPAVKNGEIQPELLNEQQAMVLMLANPLLIRRPLLQVGDVRMVGFDQAAVHDWLGLDLGDADLETCPKSANPSACHD